MKKGGRVGADEQKRRKNRMHNLDTLLNEEHITRKDIARALGCELNFISQMRHGHRPITSDMARTIERIAGMPHRSMDDARTWQNVSPLTDSEITERVQVVLKEECKRRKQPTRGELFNAMVQLAVANAKAYGFSEARVRFIAEEFMK